MRIDHDVIVIGAGFGGLYAVHKLRDELGLRVQGFEAAQGPGGVWYWNRYPGARCDFESVHYSYSFSDELQREWEWSERFAGQPEILAYLEWVADRLDVRRAFKFGTRIMSLSWDDASRRWSATADDGSLSTAQFVVSCVGGLSAAKDPDLPGLDCFDGEVLRTSSWPHEPVDFTGKRVGVIGTGSTGIQVIPEIAKQAASLTVFQRTANFAAPLNNHAIEPAQRSWNAKHYQEVRAGSRESVIGAPYDKAVMPASLASPEQRRAVYDKYWEHGGFSLLASTFTDLMFDEWSNATLADYIRERIRERVDDPVTAELLCPQDHPYGAKRPPFESGYYEAFNLPHVNLVDLRATPITQITSAGVQTAAATHDLDVLVLAIGFDAVTGALMRLGVRGRDGLRLKDAWSDGPGTFLGLQVAGFPNLFMITGPQSAAGMYNNPLAIEDHVDLTADAIDHVRNVGAGTIEPTAEAQSRWQQLTEGLLNLTLIPRAGSSWYMGANVPGKPRAAYLFAGGTMLYRAIASQVQAGGFAGFVVDGEPRPVPPLMKVDPAVALLLGGMLVQGAKPVEQCSIDELRGLFEGFALLQGEAPEIDVVEVGDPALRVYRPGGPARQPVVVFFHGGGWVAGSLNMADNPCRRLAQRLGAIVVSAAYRLAPEHPFPAATDDTFEALQWVVENIDGYGGDPDRIVVMGESAGANLAAVAALRARDAGLALAAQVLITPPIDPDASTPSREEFADGPLISVAAGDAMWKAYLSGAPVSELAAPSRAASLAGLAPALVLTVECDPTRDEAEEYGRALSAAGVSTEIRRLDGLVHGTFNLAGRVPRANELYDTVAEYVDRLAQAISTPARSS
jgi:cation diffusion facilitator CzcD-associated flavoprotein CzcO/acetyl esterase/lipase